MSDEARRKEIISKAREYNGSRFVEADETLKKDREFVLEAVKQYGYSLEYADEIFKKDREFILEAVKRNGYSLRYADETLKKDREIVLEAVKQNGLSFLYVDEIFKKDREFVLEAVKESGSSLKYADEIFKKDREIVLKAIKQNGNSLQYADEIFKKDREFVLEAVKESGYSLEYADETLKKDREIVLEAIKQNGNSLEYADEIFKKDREIVLEAIKQNGNSLEYVDEIFKKDREFVLEAVKESGYSLKYADETLKEDREIVLEAIKQNGNSLQYADEIFKKDREIVLESVKQNGYSLKYADEIFKKDREIVLEAIKQNGNSLEYVDEIFKKEREIVLKAIKRNGDSLEYADEIFKKEREIVLKAVKQYGPSLEYADEIFKKDREFILEAVKQNGDSLKYADEIFKKDREIVLEAIKQSGDPLQYADETLKKDREFVLESVKQNGYSLKYADEIFKKDREIVLESVKQYGPSLEYADEMFKKDREIVLESVKRNGYSLQYADEIFKKDREIVLKAVKESGSSLKYADEIFKKDREIVLKAVKQYGPSLKYVDDREMILLAVKHGCLLEHVDYSSLKKEIKIIESLPSVYLNTKTSKYEFLKIIDTSSIYQQLSKDIIEYYNKKFCEQNDLFYFLYFTEIFPIAKPNLLNYNSYYSTQFVEKLIILRILQNISAINPSAEPHTSKTIDYYLFCFKLEKFLEEQQEYLKQPVYFSNLKKIVFDISSKFEIFYTEKEVGSILNFYLEWTLDNEIFKNHRQLIGKYNQCSSEYLKIIRVFADYYNYKKKGATMYEIISVLGDGAEGVVFKAFDKKSKQYVAFKLSFEMMDNSTAQERIDFLLNTKIEGKIKCYEANLIGNYLYSVMEMGDDSLSDYLKRNTHVYEQLISKDYLIEILEIYTKILDSVQSIHDHSIIHRDLDPKNIVKIGDQFKIIDFDIAKVAKTGKSITLNRGKYPYMSPEVSQDSYTEELLYDDKLVENVGHISTLSDVFSMGCILLKLLTNGSLMLDKKFLLDANITDYNDSYRYFVWDGGVYFHSVLTDPMREKKLHHAIQKTIDQYIDSNFGVNNILTRCLITMIQQDPKKRLTCYQHRAILLKVINYLKDGSSNISEIEKEIDNLYTEISPLKEIPQIIEENDELKKEIKELKKGFKSQVAEKDLKINELEEEIRKLKLQLEIKQQSEY